MSKHAVNLGCYTLNLGTDAGQRVYSMLMILLPMIPLLILIGRLGTNLVHNKGTEEDLIVYYFWLEGKGDQITKSILITD